MKKQEIEGEQKKVLGLVKFIATAFLIGLVSFAF
jgi:hypothetical protein